MEKQFFFRHDDMPGIIANFEGRTFFLSEEVRNWVNTLELDPEFLPKKTITDALTKVSIGWKVEYETAKDRLAVYKTFYHPILDVIKAAETFQSWEIMEGTLGEIDFLSELDNYPVLYRVASWETGGLLLQKFPETLSNVPFGTRGGNRGITEEFLRILERKFWKDSGRLFVPVPDGEELTIVSVQGWKDQLSFVSEKRGILLNHAEQAESSAEEAEKEARKYRAKALKLRKEAR